MEICPYCDNEYEKNDTIIEKKQMGLKEFHYVYYCPNCQFEL